MNIRIFEEYEVLRNPIASTSLVRENCLGMDTGRRKMILPTRNTLDVQQVHQRQGTHVLRDINPTQQLVVMHFVSESRPDRLKAAAK